MWSSIITLWPGRRSLNKRSTINGPSPITRDRLPDSNIFLLGRALGVPSVHHEIQVAVQESNVARDPSVRSVLVGDSKVEIERHDGLQYWMSIEEEGSEAPESPSGTERETQGNAERLCRFS